VQHAAKRGESGDDETVTEFSFFWNAYFMQILANIAQFYSRNIFAIFWLAREL
jgi:hypothetical protein